eukprot:6085611-Alexandrium_andersonii.AAC.1
MPDALAELRDHAAIAIQGVIQKDQQCSMELVLGLVSQPGHSSCPLLGGRLGSGGGSGLRDPLQVQSAGVGPVRQVAQTEAHVEPPQHPQSLDLAPIHVAVYPSHPPAQGQLRPLLRESPGLPKALEQGNTPSLVAQLVLLAHLPGHSGRQVLPQRTRSGSSLAVLFGCLLALSPPSSSV